MSEGDKAFPLDVLAATTFHEMKNLLGQLTLSLDQIAAETTAETQPHVDSARFAGRRLNDRFVQLLTLYRAQEEPLHVNADAYFPGDLVNELVAEATALSRGQMAVTSRVEVSVLCFFDWYLVELAMMNAVHNALAHARSSICIGAEHVDGELHFYVQDDGAGFPEPLLAHRKTQAQGLNTGLGLRFAQAIAQAHHDQGKRGSLHLANGGNGSGATFRLCLP